MEILTIIPFMSQVNKLLLRIKNANHCKSHKFHHYATKVLHPLNNRSLVKVSGPKAAPFLQGLITNDMNNFGKEAQSLYAMFLCNRGKVLYDTLIHKWGAKAENTFMLECDNSVHYLLQKHLHDNELKRVIQIEDVTDLYKLWALITPAEYNNDLFEIYSQLQDSTSIFVYKDPRLGDLGHRLLTTPDVGHVILRQAVGHDTFIQRDDREYQTLRYSLGVSEGAEDLFPGTYFPLEANCDYLAGLSFKKGDSYVGQDVTDCVHRGGVRKRIMPIHFLGSKIVEEDLLHAKVWANLNCGRNHVGTLINRVGRFGLGLLNIIDALEARTLHVGSNPVEVTKPHWWPEEYSKEKSDLGE